MTATVACVVAAIQLVVIGVALGASWMSLRGRVKRLEGKVVDICDNHLHKIQETLDDLSGRMDGLEKLLNGDKR